MPTKIDASDRAPLSLDTFVAALAKSHFDPADEELYLDAAPLLAGLAANRDFLGTLLIKELSGGAQPSERYKDYGAQEVTLHRGDGWVLRATIWMAAGCSLMRHRGPHLFSYGVPHDYNFTLLTAGYFGPGCWSDHYLYDHDAVMGVPGEPVRLRFVERSRLGQGELRLYRRHRDVHNRHPPDSISVSLSLIQVVSGCAVDDQYSFDVERGAIVGQLATSACEALLPLLSALGGIEGAELLDEFAESHPCDRVRFGAVVAKAGAAAGLDSRAAVLERAATGANPKVAALARHRLAELETGRNWIEAAFKLPNMSPGDQDGRSDHGPGR